MKVNTLLTFPAVQPFSMDISHWVSDPFTSNDFSHHVHSRCEIYVHVTGNVSFMVEDQIYPIRRGDVIITRPNEYHHCIPHSHDPHDHFWILLSADGNEEYLDFFYNREKGRDNLIAPRPEEIDELFRLLGGMMENTDDHFGQLRDFCRFIEILRNAKTRTAENRKYPPDVVRTLTYIRDNLTLPLSPRQLAEQAHVSINTLERHFRRYVGMTPGAYICEKRLAHAAALLGEGCSVGEACERSGFTDYSGFIARFHRRFGVTPLQYRKQSRD